MLLPLTSLETSGPVEEVQPHFACVALRDPPEDLHPLVHIARSVDQTVSRLRAETTKSTAGGAAFDGRVLRAALLQSLYSFEHEELLSEQLPYNTLYRWFVGLREGEKPWTVKTYVMALERLLDSPDGTTALRAVVRLTQSYVELVKARFKINAGLVRQWLDNADLESLDHDRDALQLTDARLERAREIIQRRITDETLTPEAIADEMCMSRRNLFLLFKKRGLTPTRVIRDMRLDRCRAMLADPCCRTRKILDIALDSGFAVPATFSRCFKERFGITPNEVRAAASEEQPARLAKVTEYPEPPGPQHHDVTAASFKQLRRSSWHPPLESHAY